jgi:hemerythrin-like domain-containing protein
MKPIGPLMIEHRLIERMVSLMSKELERIEATGKANTDFLLIATDFIRMYADRTHHGKEEDILFRKLAGKKLNEEHAHTMDELIEEHKKARKITGSLVSARNNYVNGNTEVLNDIVSLVRQLVDFYPVHIEKEDKHFFYPCLEYFSKKEQDEMLNEFREFDRKLIHEKYIGTVEQWETIIK